MTDALRELVAEQVYRAMHFDREDDMIEWVCVCGAAQDKAREAADAIVDLFAHKDAEIARLTNLINTPHTNDFLEAVRREAAHQRERWGDEHDAQKTADWWLWTAAYLATKATQAERYGDTEKYAHHIITTAALCMNWHRHLDHAITESEE